MELFRKLMKFKKGQISWNKGMKMDSKFREKVSLGHKGQVPWNKGEWIKKNCETCGKEFKTWPKRAPIARFCSHPCYGEWRKTIKLSEEHKRNIGLAGKGRQNVLGKHWKVGHKKILTKEHIRNSLKRRPMSSLEIRFNEIITKHNLPYKFVGNGKFFIERKNPDFVNVNGEKKAIEVYYKRHKEMVGGFSVDDWKQKRQKIFNKYGWEIIFFDEIQVNEQNILAILRGKESVFKNNMANLV